MLGTQSLILGVGLLSIAWPGLVCAAPASPVQGMVTAVPSGDTVTLTLADQKQISVRLRDIDAPEPCQPWAVEARAALSTLALNKVATLQASGRDAQGRTVGTLLLDDLNVSRFQVENGHAWSVRTRWDQGPLVKQEKMARALTRGLHATPGAVLPKEFVRRHGRCPVGSAAEAPAPAAAPPKKK
jgi:micrococcal nuclease